MAGKNILAGKKHECLPAKFFKCFADSAFDGMQIIDLKGKVLYSNKAAEKLYRYSAKELNGIGIDKLNKISKTSAATGFAAKTIFSAIKKSGSWSGEVLAKRKDGRLFPAWLSVSKIICKKGAPVAMAGIIHDLTGRKAVENKLRESKFRLSEAQRIAHVGNWSWNIKAGELYWSKENYRIFGMPFDIKPSVREFMRHVHPDDKEAVKKAIDDALHNRKHYNIDMRIIRPDGSERIVNARAEVAFGMSGKPERMTGTVQDITERKKTEFALKASETMYRTLLEASLDLMWILDAKGKFTFFNKRAEEASGYALCELKGKHFASIISDSDLPRLTAVFRRVLNGKPQKYELSVKRKDRSIFTLSANSAPLYSEGKIIGAVSFGEDITAKKKSGEELKNTKQMLENIAQGITDSVYLISRDYKILWANAAASKITGRNVGDLIGNYCYAVTHNRASPCAPPDDVCPMSKVMETGQSVNAIHRHYDKNGRMHFVEVYIHPVKNEAGEISQFVHISRDITERQHTEQDLMKFKLGLERSGDAIFITDANGAITYVNPSFERIYGYKKSEAIGKTPRIIKSGLIPKEQYEDFWKTLLAKKTVAGEIINKRKDGTRIPIEGSNNPIIDESGKILGFLAIHHDITGRKKVEEEKNNLNDELKAKVDELERFSRLTVGRELRMIELKKKIAKLGAKK